jgi:hypothetical protein
LALYENLSQIERGKAFRLLKQAFERDGGSLLRASSIFHRIYRLRLRGDEVAFAGKHCWRLRQE